MKGICMICRDITEIRHISLYVVGSEGLDVCHSCEMNIVHFVRDLIYDKAKKKMAAILVQKGK
jgi:hypothetical protein